MKMATCNQYFRKLSRQTGVFLALLCLTILNSRQSNAQIIRYETVPSINANFDNVYVSTVHFEDFDGDGDQDVFIGGQDDSFNNVSKIYTNDSYGNFTELLGTPFTPLSSSGADFADVDNDGDIDILLTGEDGGWAFIELYLNQGANLFTLVSGTPFTPVYDAEVVFLDFDNDGDEDVYISGNTGTGALLDAQLFLNNLGVFSPYTGLTPPFEGMSLGDVKTADLNGDGLFEILVSGNTTAGKYTGLYSITSPTAISDLAHPFPDMKFSAVDFADVDGDGDQDALLTGQLSSPPSIQATELYLNNGSGSFSLVSGTPFRDVEKGIVKFEDIEGDGDQDVLIAGLTVSGTTGIAYTEIYQNDGSGVFMLTTGYTLEGVNFFGSADFGDMDNDGDKDLLVSGYGNGGAPVTRLYRNISIPYSSLVIAEIDPCYNNHTMGDIDCDGVIATSDLVILLANYGSTVTN